MIIINVIVGIIALSGVAGLLCLLGHVVCIIHEVWFVSSASPKTLEEIEEEVKKCAKKSYGHFGEYLLMGIIVVIVLGIVSIICGLVGHVVIHHIL